METRLDLFALLKERLGANSAQVGLESANRAQADGRLRSIHTIQREGTGE